jgi:ABC-type dipeptide/oligopeptide/nickel transport system permease subunit
MRKYKTDIPPIPYLSIMNAPASSFSAMVGKRLRKNKVAMVALCFIIAVLMMAIFGYWLAPDYSPNADFQTVEIQAKSPGYQQHFFALPHATATQTNWWQRSWYGARPDAQLIPIHQYQWKNDSIILQKYVDETTSERIAFFTGKYADTAQLIQRRTYWLGTDKFGRDILSRLIIGARVSLAVGCIAVFISLLLGVLLGAMAGYFGGKTDSLIMWLVNVTWSIPTLLLVFAITMAMGKGFWQIFIAVGLTMWVSVARLIRGQVMAIREQEYVLAARALGLGHFRILFKHILPNCLGPLLVIAASNFATAIIIEAGLSFLGIGIQPPQPSWGLMIKENYNFIITHHPLLALIPGFAIMLLVLAFNLLGNGLRDAVDVKSQ